MFLLIRVLSYHFLKIFNNELIKSIFKYRLSDMTHLSVFDVQGFVYVYQKSPYADVPVRHFSGRGSAIQLARTIDRTGGAGAVVLFGTAYSNR